ncbi:ABC-type nitrate/sulfonate/bicarbonate transport system protein [Methylophaga frappieri]|uniref:ABC-type nitrate/sulfonate/bicarbonate transport system protein n=1 Tax=Methylophaga frappieri (strain ATCC BAA-2434 / DSM 25690 / JAM7) TaxID=754477 RepID=I1YJM0_METFJ|nr:ABC transporter substrate-binding protein [Methylophaga frappieri]AFJ03113.1 ABC-type nitrate/sulfonate/bicarbonate transport system protein [Methylophaga frappieri]
MRFLFPAFQRLISRLCLLAFLLILSGCHDEPSSPLRVGSIPWAGYEPLFLAKSLGFYPADQVVLKELNASTETLRAIKQGQLDVAALTLDEALRLAEQLPDLRILLVMDISHGADKVISHPDIATLSQLKGKRIAVEESTVGAYMLFQTLAQAGLELNDIIPVAATINQHLSLMRSGQADAVITFDPVAFKLQKAGYQVLLDSRQIKNRILDVLVTTQQQLEQKPDQIASLLEGYWQAHAKLKAAPEEAYILIAPRLKIEPNELGRLYADLILPDQVENQRLMNQQLSKIINNMGQFMMDEGLLKALPDTDALLAQQP